MMLKIGDIVPLKGQRKTALPREKPQRQEQTTNSTQIWCYCSLIQSNLILNIYYHWQLLNTFDTFLQQLCRKVAQMCHCEAYNCRGFIGGEKQTPLKNTVERICTPPTSSPRRRRKKRNLTDEFDDITVSCIGINTKIRIFLLTRIVKHCLIQTSFFVFLVLCNNFIYVYLFNNNLIYVFLFNNDFIYVYFFNNDFIYVYLFNNDFIHSNLVGMLPTNSWWANRGGSRNETWLKASG